MNQTCVVILHAHLFVYGATESAKPSSQDTTGSDYLPDMPLSSPELADREPAPEFPARNQSVPADESASEPMEGSSGSLPLKRGKRAREVDMDDFITAPEVKKVKTGSDEVPVSGRRGRSRGQDVSEHLRSSLPSSYIRTPPS